jgi:hypothetical protein
LRHAALPLFLLVVFATISVSAQQPGASSAQATSLAASAQSALTGSTQVSDVTLTGTATRTIGSDIESGNFTLKALGQYQSRFDLVVSGGTRTEVFNLATNTPQGFWTGLDGTVHAMASHNCVAGEIWFFPALSILSQAFNSNFISTSVGQEMRQGVSVQHIQLSHQASGSSGSGQLFGQLSATDLYLDQSSNLPVAMTFNIHPDDAANMNIPVEVDFSNYQIVQGVQVPFRIQKFVNGTLLLDLTVQSAQLNTGITSAAFTSN